MKKLKLLFTIFVLATMTLMSCDDEEQVVPTEENPFTAPTPEDFDKLRETAVDSVKFKAGSDLSSSVN